MTQDVLTRGPAVTLADVERIAAGEPAWLRERRLEAWRLYESLDLPDPGDEEWRRTDVRGIDVEGLSLPVAQREVRGDAASPTFVGQVAQIDADAVFAELADEARASGVILMSLAEAARTHEALVREYLYATVRPEEWKYLALNAAAWSGGCFLYVPRDVELRLPVRFSQTIASDDASVMPRTLIVAERNARVSFIDETASDSEGRAFVSGAVEIVVGDGAKVEYYSINRWGDGVYNFNTVRAVLGRDAEFVGLAAGVGSKLTKMRLDAEMPKSGARIQLLGVTFGSGDQHFDYNTLQNHHGDHTISDLQFKAALDDSSSLVWYGITRINPGAGGSEANQTSRNMLLSEHAKAAPIPILEIEAHDVSKCSHGATAGPVDENELFYLESRGVPGETAERMLIEGFLADVIDRVPNASVRERVLSAVLAKAGGGVGDALTYDEVLAAE